MWNPAIWMGAWQVASGEVSHANVSAEVAARSAAELPEGTVITNSGRISAARFPGDAPSTPPFSKKELIALDDALKAASEKALVRFSVYIGDLPGDDLEASARQILAKAPEPAYGTLIAVSPNTRDVVIVSGKEASSRVNDRVAALGVTAAVSAFRQGNLIDGLIAALRVMSTAAAAN